MSAEPGDNEVSSVEPLLRYGAAAVLVIVSGLVAAYAGPLAASILVEASLAGYILAYGTPLRWYALASMAGAHIGAILGYYSNPLPIPPIAIIESREAGLRQVYYAANIDIVSIIIAYETVRWFLFERVKEAPEDSLRLKTPEEGGVESPGPEEPR